MPNRAPGSDSQIIVPEMTGQDQTAQNAMVVNNTETGQEERKRTPQRPVLDLDQAFYNLPLSELRVATDRALAEKNRVVISMQTLAKMYPKDPAKAAEAFSKRGGELVSKLGISLDDIDGGTASQYLKSGLPVTFNVENLIHGDPSATAKQWQPAFKMMVDQGYRPRIARATLQSLYPNDPQAEKRAALKGWDVYDTGNAVDLIGRIPRQEPADTAYFAMDEARAKGGQGGRFRMYISAGKAKESEKVLSGLFGGTPRTVYAIPLSKLPADLRVEYQADGQGSVSMEGAVADLPKGWRPWNNGLKRFFAVDGKSRVQPPNVATGEYIYNVLKDPDKSLWQKGWTTMMGYTMGTAGTLAEEVGTRLQQTAEIANMGLNAQVSPQAQKGLGRFSVGVIRVLGESIGGIGRAAREISTPETADAELDYLKNVATFGIPAVYKLGKSVDYRIKRGVDPWDAAVRSTEETMGPMVKAGNRAAAIVYAKPAMLFGLAEALYSGSMAAVTGQEEPGAKPETGGRIDQFRARPISTAFSLFGLPAAGLKGMGFSDEFAQEAEGVLMLAAMDGVMRAAHAHSQYKAEAPGRIAKLSAEAESTARDILNSRREIYKTTGETPPPWLDEKLTPLEAIRQAQASIGSARDAGKAAMADNFLRTMLGDEFVKDVDAPTAETFRIMAEIQRREGGTESEKAYYRRTKAGISEEAARRAAEQTAVEAKQKQTEKPPYGDETGKSAAESAREFQLQQGGKTAAETAQIIKEAGTKLPGEMAAEKAEARTELERKAMLSREVGKAVGETAQESARTMQGGERVASHVAETFMGEPGNRITPRQIVEDVRAGRITLQQGVEQFKELHQGLLDITKTQKGVSNASEIRGNQEVSPPGAPGLAATEGQGASGENLRGVAEAGGAAPVIRGGEGAAAPEAVQAKGKKAAAAASAGQKKTNLTLNQERTLTGLIEDGKSSRLTKGGLIRDSKGQVVGRFGTQSGYSELFRHLFARGGAFSKYHKEAVFKVLQKALDGEKLSEKQQRMVDTVLSAEKDLNAESYRESMVSKQHGPDDVETAFPALEEKGYAVIGARNLRVGDTFTHAGEKFTVTDIEGGKVEVQDGAKFQIDAERDTFLIDEGSLRQAGEAESTAAAEGGANLERQAQVQPGQAQGEVKQPWEMTRNEFASNTKDQREGYAEGILSLKGWGEPGITVENRNVKVGNRVDAGIDITYRNKEGLPIAIARLTKDANGNLAVDDFGVRRNTGLLRGKAVQAVGKEIERLGADKPLDYISSDAARLYHHRAVQKALSEGRPVPPEVLAEYPDLQKQVVHQMPSGETMPGPDSLTIRGQEFKYADMPDVYKRMSEKNLREGARNGEAWPQLELQHRGMTGEKSPLSERMREVADNLEAKSAEYRAKSGEAGMNPWADPNEWGRAVYGLAADMVRGAAHVVDFATWSAHAIKQFGEVGEEKMRRLWDEANRLAEAAGWKRPAEETPALGETKTPGIQSEIQAETAKAGEPPAAGGPPPERVGLQKPEVGPGNIVSTKNPHVGPMARAEKALLGEGWLFKGESKTRRAADRLIQTWTDDIGRLFHASDRLVQAGGAEEVGHVPLLHEGAAKFSANDPRVRAINWQGTHNRVMNMVEEGILDPAGIKNARLSAPVREVLDPLRKLSGDAQENWMDIRRLDVARRTLEEISMRRSEAEKALADAEKIEDVRQRTKARKEAQEELDAIVEQDQGNKFSGMGIERKTADSVAARQTISEFETGDPKRLQVANEISEKMRAANDAILRYAYKGGRISLEKYQTIINSRDSYVSFKRNLEGEFKPKHPEETSGGSAIGKEKKPVETYKGSARSIEDPYVSLLRTLHDVVKETDRNSIWQAFDDLAESARRADPQLAESIISDRPQFADAPQITFYRGGKPIQRYIEPMLYEQMKKLGDHYNAPEFIRKFGEFYKGMITHTPAFALLNWGRAVMEYPIISAHLKTPWGGISGTMKLGLAELGVEKYRDFKTEFEAAGGGSHLYMNDRQSYYGAQNKIIKEMQKNPLQLIITDPKHAWQAFVKGVSLSEAGPRFGEFLAAKKWALKNGMDEESAIRYAAKEAAGLPNFARAGRAMRVVNEYVKFSNPAVQGVSTLFRAWRKHPAKAAAAWATFMLAPRLAEYLYAAADPERFRRWQNIPAYQRDMFANFELPGGFIASIPLGFEMSVLSSGFSRALDAVHGKNPFAWDGWSTNLKRALMPVDYESVMSSPLGLLAEMGPDYDFFQQRYFIPPHEQEKRIGFRPGEKYASPLGRLTAGGYNAAMRTMRLGSRLDPREVDHVAKRLAGRVGTMTTSALSVLTGDQPIASAGAAWTGILRQSPTFSAESVNDVRMAAKMAGESGSKEMKKLSELLNLAYAAKGEDRGKAQMDLLNYAEELRQGKYRLAIEDPDEYMRQKLAQEKTKKPKGGFSAW